ncbi:MAG: endonuclease domain-containing protein [Bacteroidetes bacterium]|nr:endonuclease domain-containing protein [Bacteroidota bacterium]
MKYPEIKKIARELRRNPTPAEKLLWFYLKNRKLQGRKFLRQHPIIYENVENELFFFIPDFYCSEERLAIELDGPVHDYQKDRDKKRDLILGTKNIRVLRIRNEELMDIDAVLLKICNAFK